VLIRRDAIRRRVPIYRGVLHMADELLRRGVVFAQPGGCEPEVVEEGRPRSRRRRWRNRCCRSWFRVATIDTEFERITAIEILHEHSQPNQSVGPIPAHMLRSIMLDQDVGRTGRRSLRCAGSMSGSASRIRRPTHADHGATVVNGQHRHDLHHHIPTLTLLRQRPCADRWSWAGR